MDDKTILKQISGKASARLTAEALNWAASDSANIQHYAALKNKWVFANAVLAPKSADADRLIVRIRRRRNIRRAIAVGAAAAVLLGIFVLYNNSRYYSSQKSYIESQQIVSTEYTTNKGVKGKITLPDGSVVWLNSGSRLVCPSVFSGDERRLSFSGEGFFEIQTDKAHPMVIALANGIYIKVTGTKFNLKAHNDDNSVSALLVEGKISLLKNKREVTIEPNEEILVEKKNNKCTIETPAESFPIIGWKEGWLVFDDMTMAEVFKSLERWHGVDFDIKDPRILTEKVSARFKEESISQIMDLMHTIGILNYSIKDSTVTVSSFK